MIKSPFINLNRLTQEEIDNLISLVIKEAINHFDEEKLLSNTLNISANQCGDYNMYDSYSYKYDQEVNTYQEFMDLYQIHQLEILL